MRTNTKNNTITITEQEAEVIYFNGLLKLMAGNNRVVLDRLSRETLKMTRDYKIQNLQKKFNKVLKKVDFNKAVEIYKFQFSAVMLSMESHKLVEDIGLTLEMFQEFANLLNTMNKPTLLIEFGENEVKYSNDENYFKTVKIAV